MKPGERYHWMKDNINTLNTYYHCIIEINDIHLNATVKVSFGEGNPVRSKLGFDFPSAKNNLIYLHNQNKPEEIK